MSLWTANQWRGLLFLAALILSAMAGRLSAVWAGSAWGAPGPGSIAVQSVEELCAGWLDALAAESGRLGQGMTGSRESEPEHGSESEDGASSTPPAAGEPQRVPGRVNINTAGVTELTTLPGIGPVLAERIIEHRRLWGPFQHPSDLLEVRGIGASTLEKLLPFVEVGESHTGADALGDAARSPEPERP